MGSMTQNNSRAKVIDVYTGQVLASFPVQEESKAFAYAAEMEEMGLDVRVETPTLSQTLGESLGLSVEKKHLYEESIAHELDSHDGSCCFTEPDPDKPLN